MAFHVERLACLTRSNKHTSILRWYLVPHSTYYGTEDGTDGIEDGTDGTEDGTS